MGEQKVDRNGGSLCRRQDHCVGGTRAGSVRGIDYECSFHWICVRERERESQREDESEHAKACTLVYGQRRLKSLTYDLPRVRSAMRIKSELIDTHLLACLLIDKMIGICV